jgi:type I restriction-modification system DNA methylase subunit
MGRRRLRGHMDASEYKHVVLGLIFLKYISDAFEERHAELQKEKHADPEDREYAGAPLNDTCKEVFTGGNIAFQKLTLLRRSPSQRGALHYSHGAGKIAI